MNNSGASNKYEKKRVANNSEGNLIFPPYFWGKK
jgi:hypothetical protein